MFTHVCCVSFDKISVSVLIMLTVINGSSHPATLQTGNLLLNIADHRLKPMTHVRETRARNLYVCHTDLQQEISHTSFSHQIERVLFRTSFSYEFLARLSSALTIVISTDADWFFERSGDDGRSKNNGRHVTSFVQ